MSPNPIAKVLSTLRKHRVRALLMGGQACILYGAAEFSRDVDFAIAVDAPNLHRLGRALAELRAEPIYFPALSADVLRRGHACHFRCRAQAVDGLRIDVMHALRGADAFADLWRRRRRLRCPPAGVVSVMDVADLARVKKTQRDKDWPMIRRLVEADVARSGGRSTVATRRFWLRECRTADLLCELARRFPRTAQALTRERPLLAAARAGEVGRVERLLEAEERRERAADRRYWAPLRAELEQWRLERPRA